MGILRRVERGLEGAVNGVFARAFKADVQPVEVAAALQRELDGSARIVSRDRRLVPNDFVVDLSPHDHDKLEPFHAALVRELSHSTREYAGVQGYLFPGPLHIDLARDETLSTGRFAIRSSVVADQSDAGAAGDWESGAPPAAQPGYDPRYAGPMGPPAVSMVPGFAGGAVGQSVPPDVRDRAGAPNGWDDRQRWDDRQGWGDPARDDGADHGGRHDGGRHEGGRHEVGDQRAGWGAGPAGAPAAGWDAGGVAQHGWGGEQGWDRENGGDRRDGWADAGAAGATAVDGWSQSVGGSSAAPAEPVPFAHLQVLGGDRVGVEPPGVVIGRASDADVRVDDPGVSRHHAELRIQWTGTRYSLEVVDLGSTNGSVVDGQRVSRAAVRDGSRITVGGTTLQLELDESRLTTG